MIINTKNWSKQIFRENSRVGNMKGSNVTQNTISIIAQFFYFNFFSFFFWENSCLSRFYKHILKNPLIRWNKLKSFVEKVIFTCCFSVVFFFSVFTNNAGGPLLHLCLLLMKLLSFSFLHHKEFYVRFKL